MAFPKEFKPLVIILKSTESGKVFNISTISRPAIAAAVTASESTPFDNIFENSTIPFPYAISWLLNAPISLFPVKISKIPPELGREFCISDIIVPALAADSTAS